MQRRDFIRFTSAAAFGRALSGAGTSPGATVLYDDRSIRLTDTQSAKSNEDLWVRKADLPRINGFELKPQGACRADICIPIAKDMTRGAYFNLTSFARKVGQSLVADSEYQVWSVAEIPVLRGAFLSSRIAPDFAVPDRKSRLVHLSDFRGKKVLVLTWASW